MAEVQSSEDTAGSPPFAHSVALSTPPPSQSAVAKGPNGFAAINAHKSKLAFIATVHSSAAFNGSPPLAHSVALSTPPPSQSNVAKAIVGSAAIKAHTSRPAADAAVHSSAELDGSVPA